MSKNKVQIDIDVDTLQAIRKIAAMQQSLADTVKQAEILKKKADQASNAQDRLLDRGVKQNDPRAKEAWEKAFKAGNAYREATELIQRYNKSIDDQVQKLGLAGLSNKELNGYIREQSRLYNTAKRGSEEYTKAIIKLNEAEAEREKRRIDKKGSVSFFDNAKSMLMPAAIGGIAGAGVDILGQMLGNIFTGIGNKIDQVVEKADKISDIKNAIKGTTTEAERLNSEIAKLDTRLEQTTRREILIEAGKLDVPTNQLIAYTQAMTEATITMQDDFPQGAGMMTQTFTKIKSLFKDTRDLDYPSSIRQIGSALKGLADEGTATANWQSEFLLRLGALDEKVRPTITELMGIGAALEESGLTDEIAASGVQAVLSTAYKNTDLFAKFFGQSKKDFEAFINLNPNQFLFDFSEKLKPLTASQEMQTLKNLKIESQEAAKVLGVLGNKTDIIADKQGKANQYFLEGTRLTELYNEKNDNLAGKVERAWNRIGAVFSNSKLSTFLSGLIGILADGTLRILDTTTNLDKLTKSFEGQKQSVGTLEKGVLPLLDKYDKLNVNASSAAKNQDEIKKIITSLSSILPASIIQWDKYGNAIGISTDKARDFIKVQQAMLKAQNATLITELNNKVTSEESRIKELERRIKGNLGKDKLGKDAWVRSDYTLTDIVGMQNRTISTPELNKKKEEIDLLKKSVDDAKLAIKGLSGANIEMPVIPKPDNTNNNNNNGNGFGGKADEAMKKAQQQAEQRKINHQKLLDDLAQMDVKAIQNDSDRREAQIRYDFQKEDTQNKLLVEKKELSETDYQNWRSKAYQIMLKEIANNDAETTKKIEEDVKEVNTKALLRRLELHKEEMTSELELAKASEDLRAIYTAELNLNLAEQEIALAKATAEEKAGIEKSFAKARTTIHNKFIKDVEAKDQKQRADEYDGKMKAIQAEEDARKKLYDKIGMWQQSISNVVSAFFDFQAQGYQNQQTREDNLYNKKLQNLEAQKTKGIISEAEYNKKKTAFELEHDAKSREIKKKAAEADKVARIAQAVMTTAQAIINVWATTPTAIAPFLSGIVGAIGALQVAKIASTEIPEYYDGGWTHRSTAKGIDGKGGRISITHPNEFMLNARATSSPAFPAVLPILESLNAGSSVSSQTVVNNSNVSNISQNSNDNGALVQTLGKVVAVTDKLSDKLDNLEAKINWDYSTHKDYGRSKTKYEQSNEDAFLQ